MNCYIINSQLNKVSKYYYYLNNNYYYIKINIIHFVEQEYLSNNK